MTLILSGAVELDVEGSASTGRIVLTIQDTPPPRDDLISYTSALVEEGVTAVSGWNELTTIQIAADADPAHPALRIFTVGATIANGWYRITWQDDSDGYSGPTAPVQNLLGLDAGVRPSVAEVASRMRARTKVRGGGELGTFSGDTRPTADQVEGLIDDALDEVLGKVIGIDSTAVPGSAYNAPGSRYERRIRGAVSLYTAVLIEPSYFPEQVRSGQSPVAVYQQLYESRIKSLISEDKTGQPEGMGDSGGSGSGADSPADAAWSFPVNGGGLIGWNTRW